MAEKMSNVHDIFHPSPVSLKELAAIAVSLEAWRREMNECRQKRGTMTGFFPTAERVSLKSRLPDLPSVILTLIKKYLTVFGYSMERWLVDHYKRVHFCFKHQNTVLSYFDDFVCDQFGKIDYVRTAKRMIRCDQFSVDEKFSIACAYFFEDDIERLWQSGSRDNMGTNVRNLRIFAYRGRDAGRRKAYRINFHEHPHLYYWVCRLTKQLKKIPTQENNTIDDEMFDRRIPRVGPSMTYFWDRIPMENRTRKAISVANSCAESVARFILPKLDDQQLSEFVDEEGVNLMHNLWRNVAYYGENLFLTTWLYIGNLMNVTNFANLVVKMTETAFHAPVYSNYLFREIWDSTRSDLKQSVMRNISREMLEPVGFKSHECSLDFDMESLSIIAQWTSSEDRIAFLRDCCHLLIAIIPLEGLQRFMKSFFENEDELTQFKQNVMIENDLVLDHCVSLLWRSSFEKVNKFVSFCCADSQAARIFKQRLLQSAFPVENVDIDEDWAYFTLSYSIVGKPKELNQFIDEAYNDIDLSANFKNQFVSSSYNQLQLCKLACSGSISLEELIKFIDTFVPTDQVSQFKLHMVDVLKKDYSRNADSYSTPWISSNSSRSVYEVMEALLPLLDTDKRKLRMK
ncbi:uncharacterized protein LOC135847295 [Planococcus citri]|uniref:uncharacterized protein LOC135847295 n=1 Tax=Planococcus citri TaxID=170843 RepID=UPI0031F7285A